MSPPIHRTASGWWLGLLSCLLAVLMLLMPASAPRAQTSSQSVEAVALPGSGIQQPPAAVVPDNPYGLAALWAQGDLISRLTLIILVLMSMGSW